MNLSNFSRLTYSRRDDNERTGARLQNYEAFCKSEEVCTLAIFFRMLPDCPLLAAANRDEHYDRPSAPPSAITSAPKILAGRDLRAGGTWLGVNEHGLLAAILNRRTNNEDAPLNSRSRGLLCMDLLSRRSAADAALWLRSHSAHYNPFTVLVADRNQAHATSNAGRRLITEPLAPGLHVFSSAADYDLHSSKADRAYELFGAVAGKLQEDKDARHDAVGGFHAVLADHSLPAGSTDPGDAICVHRDASGTVSSSIVLLSPSGSRFDLFHCPGAPCRTGFEPALELTIS